MNSKEEVLQACSINANIVKLPPVQLERKLYEDVAKSLQHIGGKWKGGKIDGFVFDFDPSDLLTQISSGTSRNIKKELQLFETPDELAAELIEYAFIDVNLTGKILEPSAGRGAIIRAIHKYEFKQLTVRYCEIDENNRCFLQKIPFTEHIGNDFLSIDCKEEYATIIANPPFTRNQDIDHVYKMYECLKPGGRIVSIMSKHWQFTSGNKETKFAEWIKNIKAEVIEIPAGVFKKSGTSVATCIVIINKPID